MNKHGSSGCQASNEKKVEGADEQGELIFSDADLEGLQVGVGAFDRTSEALAWIRAVRGPANAHHAQAFRVLPESPEHVEADRKSLQTLGKKAFYPKKLWLDLTSPSARHALIAENAKGYGIFGQLNYTILAKGDSDRHGEDARKVIVPEGAPLCLCADIDFGAPLRDLNTLPITMRVQSSKPGKQHIYLRCAPGTSQKQWQWMQWAWVAFWGGDAAVTDLQRIIRLPGFTHRKGAPLQSKILQVAEEVEISYADLRHMMREIGAGDLTRMTAQEIDDNYTTLHAGYVRGIVSEDQLRDIANPGHPELVREIKAHSQLLQARADYLKNLTPAAKMRWPVPAPEFVPGGGLARGWQFDAQGYKNLSLFQYLGNLPCFGGSWATADASEVLAKAVASILSSNPTWEPLHALLFGSHPYRSTLHGWIRTTNSALGDALGPVPTRPGSPVPRKRTEAEKEEVIASFQAAPFDANTIYSDTELMAEDDGALQGKEIRLASGDVITVAQIRAGAIVRGEWASCFCPFHANSLSSAATVSLSKNGQVRLICRGECNKTYTSGRLVPRALSEIGWVGGHPHPPITTTLPNGAVSRYLPEITVREGVRLLVIVAPTGSGKTTQIKRISDTYHKATLVTPTQGLSASGARWLGGVSHLEITSGELTQDRIATTIDSLRRVPSSEVCPDTFQTLSRGGVLILDEYDQIEKRMFLDSNISSKAAKNRATLIEHGAAADLIIAASAGLDEGHLANLMDMFGLDKDEIQVVSMPQGAPQAHQGRVMEFLDRAEQAVVRVCGLLEAGERVCVPATEKRFVEVLAHFLREKFPSKKGIVLHAEASEDDLKTLKDVNSGWKDADYVLYNLKCGSGISYDAPNEYHTVMIAHTIRSAKGGVGADDLLQLSHRVRNPKSWSAWVSALPGNSPLEAGEILRRTLNKVRQHDWLISQFAPHLTSVGAGNDPVCKHGARVQAAASLQAATPREDMLRALTGQRAVLVAVPAPADGSPDHADLEAVEELFDAVRQQIKDSKTVAAIISEPLSQSEMKKVEMEKQAQTAEDRAAYAAAKTLDRYGKGAVDRSGQIDVALLEDTLDRSERWKQHRRLAHTCLALGGMVDVLTAHEGRFGSDGGALALDGSTLLARSVASIIKALGGVGGVDVITEQSGELEGVVFVGAESFIKDDQHKHGHNLYQSSPSTTGFSFSGAETPSTDTTSKVSLATPFLTLNGTWDSRSIPQKTADLLCLLRDQFPSLIPGLKLMLGDGNLLGAVNATLRIAGIPITESKVLVPDPAAEAAAEARRKAHAQAMRLWRKAKLDAEANNLTAPAKPICPPRIHRDRIRTYSVDQDALTLALRRTERYALGLLGGVQAPIESFDPRVCGIQESPDVAALLDISSPTSTPGAPVIVSSKSKGGRREMLIQAAVEARDEALRADVAAADKVPGLNLIEAAEECVNAPIVYPVQVKAEPTPAPEPCLMMVVAIGHNGEEAMLSVLSADEGDGLRRLEDAFTHLPFTPIGSRIPTPEEVEFHEARLPDEFWQQAA